MQPPSNAYPQPGGAAPVSTDIIGEAWQLLKPQLGMWIVALLIYGAISGVFQAIQGVLNVAQQNNPSILIPLLLLVVSLVSLVVGFLLGAGYVKMAIHHVRTGQADITKLFDISDVIAPVIVAGILVTLACAVGLVLLIVPGIIVAIGLSMSTSLIVDQKADAIDSMKRSWEATKPHLGALFVLFLLLGLINIAGACACLIGLFVTAPIAQLSLALVYRNLFGLEGAPVVAPSPFPPPPIADPRG